MTAYEKNGYKNRTEYLKELAFEFSVPFAVVCMAADMLGPKKISTDWSVH